MPWLLGKHGRLWGRREVRLVGLWRMFYGGFTTDGTSQSGDRGHLNRQQCRLFVGKFGSSCSYLNGGYPSTCLLLLPFPPSAHLSTLTLTIAHHIHVHLAYLSSLAMPSFAAFPGLFFCFAACVLLIFVCLSTT